MRFNDNVQLDTHQVEDERGQSPAWGGFGGMGGGGFGMPIAVGGGGAGLLLLLVFVVLNVLGGGLAGPSAASVPQDGSANGYNGVEVAGSTVAPELSHRSRRQRAHRLPRRRGR